MLNRKSQKLKISVLVIDSGNLVVRCAKAFVNAFCFNAAIFIITKHNFACFGAGFLLYFRKLAGNFVFVGGAITYIGAVWRLFVTVGLLN